MIALALLGALVLWLVAARARLRVTPALEVLEVKTQDGWVLSAHVLPSPQRRFDEPVLLCHGLANNHRFFDLIPEASLARALSQAGFDCYLVNLRGADGRARRPRGRPRDASVDDHVAFDVPALISAALAHSGAKRAFWVGHSLGGLVALAAAQTGDLPLAGLVAVGSPLAFRHGATTRVLLGLATPLALFGWLRTDWLTLLVAPLAGWFRFAPADGMVNHANVHPRVQRRAMASVFAPMWRSVLSQLADWEHHGTFRSRAHVDWRAGLTRLEAPTLLIAGTGDLLADAQTMGEALPAFGAADKALLIFGRAHGHSQDYGHGDLLIGVSAAREVYPPLVQWLVARATAPALIRRSGIPPTRNDDRT